MDELDEKDRTLCGCMGLGWWGEEVGGRLSWNIWIEKTSFFMKIISYKDHRVEVNMARYKQLLILDG